MASGKSKGPAGRREAKPAVKTKGKTSIKAATPKARAAKARVNNPLLERWTTPFEVPPFDRVRTEHFTPAFDRAFADNLKEIAAIAGNKAQPTFANTIDALERSGQTLDNVSAVFYNLSSTDSTPQIQAIEREIAPRFAKHSMGIYQNRALFRRVDALMKQRDKLGLSQEQARVLDR